VAAGSVDEGHAWVRLGIMDVMAQRLRSHTVAAVVPSETTVAIASESPGGDANDRRLRSLTGAGLIIAPAVELGADNQWTLKLRVLEPGASPVELVEKGADIIQLARTLADRIAEREVLSLRAEASTIPDTINTALARAHAAWIGGHAQDALNLLAALPPADREIAAAILLKAQIEVEQGRFDDDTQERLHQLIDQAAEPKNDSIVAQAELILARVSAFHGDMPAGEKILTRVLAGHALDHETLLLIDAYAQLGENLAFQARWSEASEQLAKARLLAIGTGDLLSTATIDLCQGRVDQGRGQLEQAQQSLQRAAANFETLGELHDVKRARWNLLDVQFDQLALFAAQDTGRLIAANLPGERNAAFRVVDELALAGVSMRSGLYTDVRLRLEEAQRDAASLADAPLYTHFVDVQMAELAVNAQDPEQAIHAATRAIDWFVTHGDAQGSLGRAGLALSAAYRLKNQATLSEKVLASVRRQPANERAGHIDIELDVETARVSAATGHDDDAARMFDATYERARRESPPVMQVKAAGAYLEYLIGQQRLGAAEPVAAFPSRWTTESFDAALWVGRYTAASGRREAAVATFQQAHRLAGERWDNRVQADWDELQKDSLKLTGVKAIVP
jgi:hypothetical protein